MEDHSPLKLRRRAALIGSLAAGLGLGSFMLDLLVGGEAQAPVTPKGFALVELFTSEGCSSCPPADLVLRELVRQHEQQGTTVYALSFHVDYWNSIGWRDPFSDERYTARQSAYAEVLGLRSIYTPQMIVNGQTEFVGSQKNRVDSAIRQAIEKPRDEQIELEVSRTADSREVDVRVRAIKLAPGSTINVALVERDQSMSVDRGENAGKRLLHANVVRDFVSFTATEDRPSRRLRLPQRAGKMSAIAFAQASGPRAVLAVAEKMVPL